MTEDQENLPLLHPVAERRRVFDAQNAGRERWGTCCGACFCCTVFVFIVVPTVATSVTRNRDCDATKLAGQTPPNKVPPFGSNSGLAKGKQIMRGGFKFSKRGGTRDASDSPQGDPLESPLG